MSTVFIQGYVISSKRYKRGKKWFHEFTVMNEHDNTIYNLLPKKYCAAEVGDIFTDNCVLKDSSSAIVSGNERIIVFIEDRYVKLALWKVWKKENRPYINTVYDKLKYLTEISNYKNITEYLNYVTMLYEVNKNHSEINFMKEQTELSNIQMNQLMYFWTNRYMLRQLRSLGFTDQELDNEHYSISEIFNAIIINPFTLPIIDINRCRTLNTLLSREENDYDYECGNILRYIYSQIKNNKSFCALTQDIIDKCDLNIVLEHTEFNIVRHIEDDMDYTYISKWYDNEIDCRRYFKSALDSDNKYDVDEIIFTRDDLDETQRKAIDLVYEYNITAICGGPGTGKTTITKEIVHNNNINDIRTLSIAPTGMAVFNMRDKISGIAHTIHKVIHNFSDFVDSNNDPIFDHVIIDEASMCYTNLFMQFIKLYGTDFKITFVGDCNQLEPISEGSLFEELLISKRIPMSLLKYCHRVNEVNNEDINGISANATALSTWPDYIPYDFIETSNYCIYNVETISEYNLFIESQLRQFKQYDVDIAKFKFISPYNYNSDEINVIAQRIYTGSNASIVDFKGKTFRVGDPVRMTTNSYNIGMNGIMNGQTGTIIDIEDINVIINFNNEIIRIPTRPKGKDKKNDEETVEITTSRIKVAYCITGHSSQGSEYPYVVFCVPPDKKAGSFLNRKLFYTCTTRPKSQLIMIGNKEMLRRMASYPSPKRVDALSKMIELDSDRAQHNIAADGYVHEKYKKTEEEAKMEQELFEDIDWDDDFY